jgi:hypothetical protein
VQNVSVKEVEANWESGENGRTWSCDGELERSVVARNGSVELCVFPFPQNLCTTTIRTESRGMIFDFGFLKGGTMSASCFLQKEEQEQKLKKD